MIALNKNLIFLSVFLIFGVCQADFQNTVFLRKGFPGPCEVSVKNTEVYNDVKLKKIPITLYIPETDGMLPSVVFSHDFDESKESYHWLGQHWASYGYLCVFITHTGSDEEFFKTAPYAAKNYVWRNMDSFRNRAEEIQIVLDELSHLNTQGMLKNRINIYKTAVCGKNIGAWAALSVSGQVYYRNAVRYEYSDERVKAAVCFSPFPVEKGKIKGIYSQIAVPCMHITGQNDSARRFGITPQMRRIPFDSIEGCEQVFVSFKDQVPEKNDAKSYSEFENHRIIRILTTAFFDAYLKGNHSARNFLFEGSAGRISGIDTIYETRW